jgi:hypothetical protein
MSTGHSSPSSPSAASTTRWAADIWLLILVWTISVLAAVAPVGIAALFQTLIGRRVTWEALTSRGELFLVAVGIGAGAVGDVILGHTAKRVRALVGILAGLVIAAGLVTYGLVYVTSEFSSVATSNAVQMDAASVATASTIALAGSIAIAIASRIVGALK